MIDALHAAVGVTPLIQDEELAQFLRRPGTMTVSYTHLRAHETVLDLVCRLLLEKKKTQHTTKHLLHTEQ